jgi:hypothetical protein
MRRSGFCLLSIAEIAERASRGEQVFDLAVREFLDSWQSLSPAERPEALAEEPVPIGPVEDAYLAALAEHLASLDKIDVPGWTEAPQRFPARAVLRRRTRIVEGHPDRREPLRVPPALDLHQCRWAFPPAPRL